MPSIIYRATTAVWIYFVVFVVISPVASNARFMCGSGLALVWWCLLLARVCSPYEFSRCDLQCAQPQPRVFFLSRLLQPTETYFPHNVVLYRCDSSTGCCAATNKQCAVFTRECIGLDVAIKNITTKVYNKPRKFAFWNHTECSCQLSSDVTTSGDLCEL